MGRTYEATRRSEREPKASTFHPVPYIEKSIEPFYQIEGFHEAAPFTGICQGNGCTTTVGYFSIYLATKIQKKVLLMDLNLIKPDINRFFEHDEPRSFLDIYSTNSIQDCNLIEPLKRNLVVVTNDGEPFEEASGWLDSNYFDDFLQTAKTRFDYIFLDSAPISASHETRIISPRVDAVILLLESGRSRRKVALKIKKDIEESGGRILGTIINKRNYYIPKWLYNKL